jgi:transcriptional regulator with XRE-family HTH domain
MEKSTHTPEYDRLKSTLRETRQGAGLSQRELALRLRVPHSWVAKVESGERRIDLIEFGWFIAGCGGDAISICGEILRKLPPKRAARRSKGGRAL